jgi:hypothetical protein
MRFLSLGVVVFLAGCTSAGTRVDPTTVAAFEKGHTTVPQAEAALGDPDSIETRPDGSIVLIYSYSRSTVRAATLIPLVGGLVGSPDTKTQTVALRFGLDGTYQDATRSTATVAEAK